MRKYSVLNTIAIFFFSVVLILFGWHYLGQRKTQATIIILNGPSSSGKSSTAKKLQELLGKNFLTLGVDEYTSLLLPKTLLNLNPQGTQPSQGMQFIREDDAKGPKVTIGISPYVKGVFLTLPLVAATLAQAGYNLIIDAAITYDEDWLRSFTKHLNKFKVYLVKITAPIPVLQEREVQRKGFIGLARGQAETMEQIEKKYAIPFDLVIDTEKLDVTAAAQAIKQMIEHNECPQAFNKIAQVLKQGISLL
jgi:chloramphenicol 3-O phosphotransferase